MEQFFKENIFIVIAIAAFLVWFILTCINSHYKKRWLYITELIVLLANVTCDVCLAAISGITTEAVEITIQLIAMAGGCGILSMIVLKDFYKNCYRRNH